MKSTILTIGGILVAVNLMFGLLLSSYNAFNVGFTTVALILTITLIYVVHTVRLSDAAKVAFTILLPVSGFFKFVLGIISPARIEDNWCMIGCVLLTVIEVVIVFCYHKLHHFLNQ